MKGRERKTSRIGVRLGEDTRRRVVSLAAARDCSISELVTALILAAIDQVGDLSDPQRQA